MKQLIISWLAICFLFFLALGDATKTIGQEAGGEKSESAFRSSADPESDSDLKEQIEAGVWVIGNSHRFAEVGKCDSFSVAPDGMTIACNGSKIKLFDLNEDRVRDTVGEKNEYYQSVEYSPDGRFLVASTNRQGEAIIRVWDAIDLSLVNTIVATQGVASLDGNPNFFIQELAVSPDGSFVAASNYNSIVIRDSRTGELLEYLDKLGYVQSVGFSADESQLFFSKNNRFQAVDLESGEQLSAADCSLVGMSGSSLDVNFSGNLVATSRSNSVQVISLDGSNTTRSYALPSGCYGQRVAFSDDGSLLAVAVLQTSGSGVNRSGIVVLNSETGRVVKHVKRFGQNIKHFRFSTDNRYIFHADYGGFGINELDLTTDESTAAGKFPKSPTTVGLIHPNNESFVALTQSGEGNVFDLATGQIQSSFEHPNPKMLEFSLDGESFMVGSSFGQASSLTNYDFPSGKKNRDYSIKSARKRTVSLLKSFMLRGNTNSVRKQTYPLGFSVSGSGTEVNLLAMELLMVNSGDWMTGFDYDQTFSLQFAKLNFEDGSTLQTRRFPFSQFGARDNRWIQIGAVSPNGDWIAVADGPRVTVADTETGDTLFEIEVEDAGQPLSQISSILFSPDNKSLITNSFPRHVHVWDADTGALIRKLELEKSVGRVLSCFSRRGERLVVCGESKESEVKVYDTESWKEVLQRDKSQHNRQSIAISDDGQFLLLGLSDCRLEIWELAKLK